MRLPSGTLLQGGKYKIITKIGQGGFGIVYKALHVGLQRDICIKEFFFSDYCQRATNSTNVSVISTSAEKIQLVDSLRKKFTKEAQRLAQFQNPHIIQVMDNFEENNTAYFVMEYLEGGSLEERIEREGTMSEEKAISLILPIIDALDAVHSIGLLHLDIKPSNIMLRKNQSLVLIDFGISKYMETAQGNTTTAPIGISKGYAPLEQYGGTIANFSKATDVYSLCATLYKMVTGVTPPEPLQIMASGIKSPKELNSQLSVKFSNVILSGLLTKATERPQTMGQLKSKLGSNNSNNNETYINSGTYNSERNNPKTTINAGSPPRTDNYNSNRKSSTSSSPYWIIGALVVVIIIVILANGSSNSPKQMEQVPTMDSVVVTVDDEPMNIYPSCDTVLVVNSNDNTNARPTNNLNDQVSVEEVSSISVKYYPSISKQDLSYCIIKRIERLSKETIVYFKYKNPYSKEGWVSVNKDIFIRDTKNKTRYLFLDANNLPISPQKYYFEYEGQELDFELIFEPIPISITNIDIIEDATSNHSFNFYGVEI